MTYLNDKSVKQLLPIENNLMSSQILKNPESEAQKSANIISDRNDMPFVSKLTLLRTTQW